MMATLDEKIILTEKEQNRVFWGPGEYLYFDQSDSNIDIFISNIPLNLTQICAVYIY